MDEGPSKPDPALFRQACAALGVEPEETLMVGDTPVDIRMAQQAGAMGCVAVSWGLADSHQLQLAQADVVIANLNALTLSTEA